MSSLRFHHVFLVLMLLALVSAFILKPEQSARLQPQVQTLFAPIASPLSAIGRAIESRLRRPDAVDPRSATAVREENEALRVENASLQAQLDDLKILNADRESLGEIRKQSRPYAVVAKDSGNREAVSIGGSSLQGLAVDQPVIYRGGLAGRVSAMVGVGGAKVRLITDTGFSMTGGFGRFVATPEGAVRFVPIKLSTAATAWVRGMGNNTLVIDTISMKDVTESGLKPRDWVVLDDPAWPPNLQGYAIGEIKSIAPRPDSPLFAKITLEPAKRLKLLTDVNVVVK